MALLTVDVSPTTARMNLTFSRQARDDATPLSTGKSLDSAWPDAAGHRRPATLAGYRLAGLRGSPASAAAAPIQGVVHIPAGNHPGLSRHTCHAGLFRR